MRAIAPAGRSVTKAGEPVCLHGPVLARAVGRVKETGAGGPVPPKDRDACDRLLKAIFDRGLGQRQIARVTGIPLSTVQRALQRVIYPNRQDRPIGNVGDGEVPTWKERRAKLESLAIEQLQPTRGPTAGTKGQVPKSRSRPGSHGSPLSRMKVTRQGKRPPCLVTRYRGATPLSLRPGSVEGETDRQRVEGATRPGEDGDPAGGARGVRDCRVRRAFGRGGAGTSTRDRHERREEERFAEMRGDAVLPSARPASHIRKHGAAGTGAEMV